MDGPQIPGGPSLFYVLTPPGTGLSYLNRGVGVFQIYPFNPVKSFSLEGHRRRRRGSRTNRELQMKRQVQIGNMIKKVYLEKLSGNPDDLVHVYEKAGEIRVVRNDDTEATIAWQDIENLNEDRIAEALRNFEFIE
jgi:hypothetical protein